MEPQTEYEKCLFVCEQYVGFTIFQPDACNVVETIEAFPELDLVCP